jgi:hypothetical protein
MYTDRVRYSRDMLAPYTTPLIPALASQRAESPQGPFHTKDNNHSLWKYMLFALRASRPTTRSQSNGPVVNGPCTRGAQSSLARARTPKVVGSVCGHPSLCMEVLQQDEGSFVHSTSIRAYMNTLNKRGRKRVCETGNQMTRVRTKK